MLCRRIGGVVAHVEYDAGIVNGGALAADDRLIAQSIQDFRISIAARRPIGAGRYQRWIRDGRDWRWSKQVGSRDAVEIEPTRLHRVYRVRQPGGQSIELGLNRWNLPIACL